ncbi:MULTISPECIES: DnaA N-terminal domain-containing protein [Lederbergia]|uniref:Chromosomal replication initiator protein DnaA n=1 Tax=Lederbergia lenta TaxID=1467 RepID=A0A2X4WI27_LEDLE|nr:MULTISPECIES: DnaA N-terminal domain-containing protein [Lederbergia]MCR2822744.1 hypothetical protein [Lederbergia panacisoli]MEC2326219.1 DnaA N-terminal domain-containing protein [Lederbergia lenta]SQI63706.1 chromosomal replication initiator protein DnaA [Lederbergia lenta]
MDQLEKENREFWEIILQQIEKRLSKPMYQTWIAPLSGKIVEGNTIIIKAKTEFAKEWIIQRYLHHFTEVLKELTGQEFNLQVIYLHTKEERKESDSYSAIEKKVIDDDSSQQKYKKVSVEIPIITPSNHSIRLRRENERIIRSLNLPLADVDLSNMQKRIYAKNERIREKRKCRENGIFGSLFRSK